MNGEVREEIEVSMDDYFPRCENSTPIQLYGILANIVTQVSGRIFVGSEIDRDSTYLECAVNYAHEIMHVTNAVRKLRPWQRPILTPRLPESQRLRNIERKMKDCVEPIIRQRIETEKSDPTWQKPDDMLQWMLARSKSSNATETLLYITKQQLLLTFAAVHTTTMVTTNIRYTLAATTEYVPALREEISTVLAENGGVPTPKALQQMVKLDSYMREVNRCYPPGLSVFARSVLKPITLSNGQQIPTASPSKFLLSKFFLAGIRTPTPMNSTASSTTSSESKRADRPSKHALNLSPRMKRVSLGGYGKHACPGRFFAASEIKMLLIKFIMDYDMSMPDGRKERYAQVGIGSLCAPDTTKELVFKRVVRH